LKKRTKKLLQIQAEPIRRGRSQYPKVFCFFFSKKKRFLPLAFACPTGYPLRYRDKRVVAGVAVAT
jgi:hypothetical protein